MPTSYLWPFIIWLYRRFWENHTGLFSGLIWFGLTILALFSVWPQEIIFSLALFSSFGQKAIIMAVFVQTPEGQYQTSFVWGLNSTEGECTWDMKRGVLRRNELTHHLFHPWFPKVLGLWLKEQHFRINVSRNHEKDALILPILSCFIYKCWQGSANLISQPTVTESLPPD